MKKNVIKMISENEAQVSKAFEKKARIYGTPEYKMWREFKAENPNCNMITKTIKKNPNKKTTLNLKYENMETFIDVQENKDILKAEFEKVKIMSKVQKNPYRYVLDWFEMKFKGYESFETFVKNVEEQREAEKKNAETPELKAVSNM